MNRGYVKLWRKIEESAVFQNEGLLKVFVWCLLRANHKETWVPVRTGRGFTQVKLTAGSFIFGRMTAAKELKMPEGTAWKRMLKLEKLEILDIQRDTHYSIIHIINWIIYQAETEKTDRQEDTQGTGKEHRQELKELKELFRQNSLEVLSYLNEKTGKRYRDASFIEARLKDGGTVDQCKRIIDTKLLDAHFRDYPKYLNPQTLFRPSHWDNYLNEALPLKPREETAFKYDPAEEIQQ